MIYPQHLVSNTKSAPKSSKHSHSCAFHAVWLESLPSETRDDALYIRQTPEAGRGVFLKAGYVLTPGDVVTKYPGNALRWRREGNLPTLSSYAFLIGPVKVQGDTGKWFAYVDAQQFALDGTMTRSSEMGHMVNTSHPCLPSPYNVPNCAFGVYFEGKKLTEKTRPKVYLYIVCTTNLFSPVDGSRDVQLLVDYHWLLASERGKWCERETCRPCVSAALSFFKRLM